MAAPVPNAPVGQIYQTTWDFRAQVQEGVTDAVALMQQFYSGAYDAISGQLDTLAATMDAASAAGEDITPAWLQRQGQLQSTLDQIQAEIDRFSGAARETLGSAQAHAAALGVSSAQGQINASTGVSQQWGVPSQAALESLAGAMVPSSPLYDLFQQMGPDAATAVRLGLFNGLAAGQNPRVVAAQLSQDVTDLTYRRAETIARTEMLRAYRSAALQTYQANSDVVQGWTWLAGMTLNTCGFCWSMNGSQHTLDETLDSHAQCACQMLPNTSSWSDLFGDLGMDDLETLDEEGGLPPEPVIEPRQPPGMQEKLTLNAQEREDYKWLQANGSRFAREVVDYGLAQTQAEEAHNVEDAKYYEQLAHAAQSQLNVLADFERRLGLQRDFLRQMRQAKADAQARYDQRLARALPGEMARPSVEVPSGEQVFAGLSPEEQRAILGPSKYALYANGDLSLADIAGHGVDEAWGGYGYEKSLSQLGYSAADVQAARDTLSDKGGAQAAALKPTQGEIFDKLGLTPSELPPATLSPEPAPEAQGQTGALTLSVEPPFTVEQLTAADKINMTTQGGNEIYRVVIDGQSYVVKSTATSAAAGIELGEADLPRYYAMAEVAATRIADIVGLSDVVTPTYALEVNGEWKVISEYAEHGAYLDESAIKALTARDVESVTFLDYVIGEEDANRRGLLYDAESGHLLSLDHSASLNVEGIVLPTGDAASKLWRMKALGANSLEELAGFGASSYDQVQVDASLIRAFVDHEGMIVQEMRARGLDAGVEFVQQRLAVLRQLGEMNNPTLADWVRLARIQEEQQARQLEARPASPEAPPAPEQAAPATEAPASVPGAPPFTVDQFAEAQLHPVSTNLGGVNQGGVVEIDGQQYFIKNSRESAAIATMPGDTPEAVALRQVNTEVAAAEIAQTLGLGDLTTPTYRFEYQGEPWVASSWIEHAQPIVEVDRATIFTISDESYARVAVLNYALGETDANPGNLLVRADGGLITIDHGFALDEGGVIRYDAAVEYWHMKALGASTLRAADAITTGYDEMHLDPSVIADVARQEDAVIEIMRRYGLDAGVPYAQQRFAILRALAQMDDPTVDDLIAAHANR